jgi:hypothetical protein
MNCVELQHSLVEIEDGSGADQRAHLKTCPTCSSLIAELNLIADAATDLRAAEEPSPRVWRSIQNAVERLEAELNLIASSAVSLRETHEPGPRVWNSIEIALRQEGLIRPQGTKRTKTNRSLLPSLRSQWAFARWALPVAAVLLIAVSLYLRQQSVPGQLAKITTKPVAVAEVSDASVAGLNDDDLLQEVAGQSPAMKAQYADNLLHVNQFIQDAKSDVDANPNDEEARRSLMAAYQEKAMLFELAMDHPLTSQ